MSDSDLSWDAFRYIADEMSADEQARFEERLAIDQRAREGVALAVEIAQGVAAVPDQFAAPATTSDRKRFRQRRRAILSVAVAAAICLAFALGWQLGGDDGPALTDRKANPSPVTSHQPADEMDEPDTSVAVRLVSLWSAAGSGASEGSAGESDRDALPVALAEWSADVSDASLDIPDWMWVAVTADLPPRSETPADWEDN